MKILSLNIENFRAYKGPIQIDFSTDKNKNFTIIEGTNGTGKTSILNAITWCLYGEELHNKGLDKNKSLSTKEAQQDPIYNEIIENKAIDGDIVTVKVSIHMLDDDEEHIHISRSLKYTQKNGKLIPNKNTQFDILYSEDGNDYPLNAPQTYIKQHMPKDIEEYFFFDGERLEEYFDETSGGAIKDNVMNISQLKYFADLNDSINNRITEYKNKSKNLGTDEGDFINDKQELEEKIGGFQNTLDQKNKIISDCQNKIKSLTDELISINNEDEASLRKQINELDKQYDSLIKQRDKLKEKKQDFMVQMFPLILNYSSMKETYDKGSKMVNEGDLPPDIKEQFLRKLLKDNRCICGAKLDENSEARDHIVYLAENTSPLSNIAEKVTEDITNIKNILKDTEDFDEKRLEFNHQIGENINLQKENRSNYNELKLKYDEIDIERIQEIKEQIQSFDKVKSNALSEVGTARFQLEQSKREYEQLKKKEEKLQIKNQEAKEIQKRLKFCKDVQKQAELIEEKLIEKIREDVEEFTNKQFQELMWKTSIKKINIDSEYNVMLTKNTGKIYPPKRYSAGEKLVLALSFVAALNTISGFDLPFIIDTPMGRLGKLMKDNISKSLPITLKDKQVTLLVTDEEYTTDFRNEIIDKVGKEYKIQFHEGENGDESEVVLNE